MNEAIDEYLNQDQEVKDAALPEVEEFEAAFDLVQNVPEEGLEANRRQRVTWRDIIEQEEGMLQWTIDKGMRDDVFLAGAITRAKLS